MTRFSEIFVLVQIKYIFNFDHISFNTNFVEVWRIIT